MDGRNNFELKMESGKGVGGTITLSPGKDGQLCRMNVRNGYETIRESEIDLSHVTIRKLISYLEAIYLMHRPFGDE